MVLVEEEITTLIVSNLPSDLSEREFNLMFAFAAGFEFCQLNKDELGFGVTAIVGRKKSAPGGLVGNVVGLNGLSSLISNSSTTCITGFVRFKTAAEAISAQQVLNNYKIDNQLLSCDLHKQNIDLSDSKPLSPLMSTLNPSMSLTASGSGSGHFSHRASRDFGASIEIPTPNFSISQLDTSIDDIISSSGRGSVIKPPGGDLIPDFLSDGLSGLVLGVNERQGGNGLGSPKEERNLYGNGFGGNGSNTSSGGMYYGMAGLNGMNTIIPRRSNHAYRPPTSTINSNPNHPIGENPPCNTLYVGNLPMNASEDELRLLFMNSPGYKRLSFRMKSNGPMCFVEFEDVTYATMAMNELYGTILSSSTKGGIRLSYSKNPLGVRPSPPTPTSNPALSSSASQFFNPNCHYGNYNCYGNYGSTGGNGSYCFDDLRHVQKHQIN